MKALLLGSAIVLAGAHPAFAQSSSPAKVVVASSAALDQPYAAFIPRPSKSTRFDYSIWDDALDDVVLDMGPSLRRRATAPTRRTSSRLQRGHDSPYRLEGSRFTFAFISDAFEENLGLYRQDLEELGTSYDIASLPRNEQLAYWINLHNVALIEKISEAYPVKEPSRIKVDVDGRKAPLDEAKFITVKGVPLSLRDIRTRIVYPNWRDRPETIYGFFRGDIGGPRMSENAFTANYVDLMLDENAEEFVNSLRGFNNGRNVRYVSEIYREAQPFYFPNLQTDLVAHFTKHAREDVLPELGEALPVKFESYERRVADLSGGNGRGADAYGDARLSFEASEFIREAEEKYRTLISKGLVTPRNERIGTVTIEDITTEDLAPDPQYAPYADTGGNADE